MIAMMERFLGKRKCEHEPSDKVAVTAIRAANVALPPKDRSIIRWRCGKCGEMIDDETKTISFPWVR